MSSVESARRAEGFVGINGVNVWGDIKKYVGSIEYTEVASGETDSFDITVSDYDGHFKNEWALDKGTILESKFRLNNWNEPGDVLWIDCGTFLVDSEQLKIHPDEVVIKSLAIPVNGSENTQKWEEISVKAIAEEFCKRWGCELEYYADDITIKSRQQSLQKDIVFLFSLCKEYGFGMKAYRNKIIIFDREKQDAADPVLTVGLRNAESGDVNDNFEGLYTGAECSYKPEGSDDEQTFTYGDTERLLKLSVSATSAKEAELKCKAQLYDNNSKAVQLEFSMLGGIAPIYAGSNYIFEDLGVWNGKYAVDKVTHTLTGKKGYRINVEAHGVDILKYNPNFGKDTNDGSDNSAIQEITGTAPGRAVVLKDTPLYISSDARAAVRNVTGTYYLYDGKDFGGRYRICNQDEVGATPTSANVSGYIDGSAFLGG